jgi:hypothetical protein
MWQWGLFREKLHRTKHTEAIRAPSKGGESHSIIVGHRSSCHRRRDHVIYLKNHQVLLEGATMKPESLNRIGDIVG